MKILIVSHGFQTHYTIGFVNGIAHHLSNIKLVRSSNLEHNKLHDSVISVDLGQNLGNESSSWVKAWRFFRYHFGLLIMGMMSFNQCIHVIGLLQREILSGVIQGTWFRIWSKKYILTVHNILPHDSHTQINKYLFSVIYRIPHCLVVHTQKMKLELVSMFGLNPENILIVEHGVNDAVQLAEKDSELNTHLTSLCTSDKVSLLFFGFISPYKGLEVLLEAFELLDEHFNLIIAGNPRGTAYKARIEQLIIENKCQERINANLGWVHDDDIPSYFKMADFLVMPYQHIDQSGLIFLSFRYGLPIIASDVGSIREYLGTVGGEVVEPGSAYLLASKLNDVASRKSDFDRNTIKAYAKQFEWQETVKPLINWYKSGFMLYGHPFRGNT